MNRLIPPFRAARRKNASFSLVEIVIALAVTTFSIVALLALLPVGVNTALQSRHATRAAYLAEQIVSDLRASPFTNATILCQTNSSGTSTLTNLPSFGLNTNATYVLICDGGGNVLTQATNGASDYTNGVGGASANYLAQVTVVPTTLTNVFANVPIVFLSSVSVEVSAPAQAKLSTRARYGFQTMIGNRQ